MKYPNILIIDDSEDIHAIIKARLRSVSAHLHHALTPKEGIEKAQSLMPDLILLDVHMPEMSGFEVCQALKSDPGLVFVPVIFLTGLNDVEAKIRGFDAGAVDYITKPFEPAEMRARVRSALRTKYYLDLLAERAQLDGLTGLWNRRYSDQRMEEELQAYYRYDRRLSILLIDIDHFKNINDTYGHPFGDEVLQQFAQKINSSTRRCDVACRYGGEEFIIFLPETAFENARVVAQHIHEAMANLDLAYKGKPVKVTCSIGASSTDQFEGKKSSCTGDTLVALADGALYEAKHSGRNRTVMASPPFTSDLPAVL